MKRLFVILFFHSIISFSQNKQHVVYFINLNKLLNEFGTIEEISVCDSTFLSNGSVHKSISSHIPYYKYNCSEKIFTSKKISPNDYSIFNMEVNTINFKIKQVDDSLSIIKESHYYDLNYSQKKKNNLSHYKGLKRGIENVGYEIGFNNITLINDTTYFLIQNNLEKIYYTKFTQSYVPYTKPNINLIDVLFSVRTEKLAPIEIRNTFIDIIDKKRAKQIMYLMNIRKEIIIK